MADILYDGDDASCDGSNVYVYDGDDGVWHKVYGNRDNVHGDNVHHDGDNVYGDNVCSYYYLLFKLWHTTMFFYFLGNTIYIV
jgi:hypothetical protein